MNEGDQDYRRWLGSWEAAGVSPPPADVYQKLVEAYTAPDRHYHSLVHIHDCFSQLDACGESATNQGAVELAIWFHDVIYDTRTQDNELQSARYAVEVLKSCGAGDSFCDEVEQLILITQHKAEPQTDDERLIVDIDLSILGARVVAKKKRRYPQLGGQAI